MLRFIMNSFFLLCSCLSLTSVQSQLLFEQFNKCGCFRSDKCPAIRNTECGDQNENLHDLYAENSGSSLFPEKCDKWFKGFMTNVTVSESGKLNIKLYFSQNLFDLLKSGYDFELHLRYQSQCRPADSKSSFYSLDSNHSVEYITFVGTKTDSCIQMAEVSFSYVFSGCYQFYVTNIYNSTISNGCMSKPFIVTSSYKKAPLNQFKPKHYIQQKRQGSRISTVFGNFSHGPNPHSTLITLKSQIDTSLGDCAGSGNLAAKYVLVGKGECCHAIDHETNGSPKNMSVCPCNWEDDTALICKFTGLKNGNYCVVIEFIDPRCEKSTLWLKSGTGNDCMWSFPIEVARKVDNTSTNDFNFKSSNFLLKPVLYLSFFILGMICISYFILHVFKRKKSGRLNTFEEKRFIYQSMSMASSIDKEFDGILLLYPRDCEEFMEAMEQFRIILKESCLCTVYDPWDEEIIDKVAESVETWSLPFIANENTKIIVVLTELSKMIEEAYIDDKHCIAYRDPNILDKVFGQTLKAINEYFATRSDSYQRVFVVRLGDAPKNLSFYFNCATCYFLPHKLQDLVNDIKNKLIEVNAENSERLKIAINKYLSYKQTNSSYTIELIKVNNNHKIAKIL